MATTIFDEINKGSERCRRAAMVLYKLNQSNPICRLLEYDESGVRRRDMKLNWHKLIALVHDRFPEDAPPLPTDSEEYLNHFLRTLDEVELFLWEEVKTERRRQALIDTVVKLLRQIAKKQMARELYNTKALDPFPFS